MPLARSRIRELEALYAEILAEYGPALGRVAATYEFAPVLRRLGAVAEQLDLSVQPSTGG